MGSMVGDVCDDAWLQERRGKSLMPLLWVFVHPHRAASEGFYPRKYQIMTDTKEFKTVNESLDVTLLMRSGTLHYAARTCNASRTPMLLYKLLVLARRCGHSLQAAQRRTDFVSMVCRTT